MCGNTVCALAVYVDIAVLVIERLWKELTGGSSPAKLTKCSYDFTKLKCLLVPDTSMIMIMIMIIIVKTSELC
jgi:hypothetical protein